MQPTQGLRIRRAVLLGALLSGLLTACAGSAAQPAQTLARVYVANLTKGQAAYAYTQTVSALSPGTGQARWSTPLETGNLIGHWGAPVISSGVVYATSARA